MWCVNGFIELMISCKHALLKDFRDGIADALMLFGRSKNWKPLMYLTLIISSGSLTLLPPCSLEVAFGYWNCSSLRRSIAEISRLNVRIEFSIFGSCRRR